jgi:hypothetical protein
MSLDFIPDYSKHNRPRPSMPTLQSWHAIYIEEPVRRIVGHLVARPDQGGYEAVLDYSGERSLGIYAEQADAEAAIYRKEVALAERPTARRQPEPAYPDLPEAA